MLPLWRYMVIRGTTTLRPFLIRILFQGTFEASRNQLITYNNSWWKQQILTSIVPSKNLSSPRRCFLHSHLSTMPTRCDDGAQPYKFDAKLVILLQQKGRYSIDQLKRRRKVLAESELYLEVNFFLFLTIFNIFLNWISWSKHVFQQNINVQEQLVGSKKNDIAQNIFYFCGVGMIPQFWEAITPVTVEFFNLQLLAAETKEWFSASLLAAEIHEALFELDPSERFYPKENAAVRNWLYSRNSKLTISATFVTN